LTQNDLSVNFPPFLLVHSCQLYSTPQTTILALIR
jgi:hypothetical protein